MREGEAPAEPNRSAAILAAFLRARRPRSWIIRISYWRYISVSFCTILTLSRQWLR
jgi:hypothetical protein